MKTVNEIERGIQIAQNGSKVRENGWRIQMGEAMAFLRLRWTNQAHFICSGVIEMWWKSDIATLVR